MDFGDGAGALLETGADEVFREGGFAYEGVIEGVVWGWFFGNGGTVPEFCFCGKRNAGTVPPFRFVPAFACLECEAAVFIEDELDGGVVRFIEVTLDGAVIIGAKGWASAEYVYDEAKHRISESYYGTDGQLMMLEAGYAKITREYDAGGNLASETKYDVNGDVIE